MPKIIRKCRKNSDPITKVQCPLLCLRSIYLWPSSAIITAKGAGVRREEVAQFEVIATVVPPDATQSVDTLILKEVHLHLFCCGPCTLILPLLSSNSLFCDSYFCKPTWQCIIRYL